MLDLNLDECRSFEAASGSLFEAFTIFPIHGIKDGRCTCKRADCKPANAGKHPAILWNSEDHPDGSKMIRRDDGVGVGIGIATGARSGGVLIVDVDGADGPASLAALEARIGRLPETLTVVSPSGGLHYYFRHPGRFQSNASVVAPHIDIRAEGGYAVLPGSPHRKGGVYRVEIEAPIALLPGPWADFLPRQGAQAPARAIVRDVAPTDQTTLRERLRQTAKGKRGDEWTSWRSAALGERLFRLEGMPEGPAPLVIGVDEYINKRMIWGLASVDAWHEIPGSDVAALLAPSLSILREDAEALGTPSKWSGERLAERWDYAANKIAAQAAEGEAFAAALIESATQAHAAELPPILLLDDKFLILDDRTPNPRYETHTARPVPLVARDLWGTRRVLEVDTPKGRRPMRSDEIAEHYGRSISRIDIDHALSAPVLEDRTLVNPPDRLPFPEPALDPEVAAWLDALDPTGAVLAWIHWAAPERARTTVPALTLIGGAHVGKSLLADAAARAAGATKAPGLAKVLGRFTRPLASSLVLFGDEGMPQNERTGQPMTREFRALITSPEHVVEQKGTDRELHVRGGVRVVLAANLAASLFSSRGLLGAHDVDALVRRLLVIDILDDARIARAKALAQGLGPGGEGCPIRLGRVAAHFRAIQVGPAMPAPEPYAGSLASELRRGGDQARAALDVLEDKAGDPAVDWIAADPVRGVVWVRPEFLARAAGISGGPGPLMRHLVNYICSPNAKRRSHPVTGAVLEGRPRWVGLSLAGLRRDIDLSALVPPVPPC